jgi:hypothetical protein
MASRLTTPITKAAAVTPSDTVDLTTPTRGIYIDGLAISRSTRWAATR